MENKADRGTCRNLSTVSDSFKCSECELFIEDWTAVAFVEYTPNFSRYYFEFQYCPECGRKVIKDDQ